MKRIITIAATFLMTVSVWAQAPQKMSYQAVIRDAGNSLVDNQGVGMQISILKGSASGTAVYVETQNPTTNVNGLVSIEIGTGTVVSGDFATIDWSTDSYYIKTETDPTGGSTYTITGTSELMSVPYALHAKTVETINVPGNNTISIPAFALAKSPTTAHISEASGGLRWGQNYVGGTSLTVKKPANYTGGDVEFTILFRTLASTTTGEVDFFIRPVSYNNGDATSSPVSLNSTSVSINGANNYYEQSFTIPASELTKDWWQIGIQRQGSNSTFTEDVLLTSVALDY